MRSRLGVFLIASILGSILASALACSSEPTPVPTNTPVPAPATLESAKRAWLIARDDYGPTEAFRFYGGPIDNE